MGRRDDICDAALSIISEGGIRALTLPVLFKRAQTGAGTFYHHFRDREDLIDAVYERCYRVAKEQLEGVDDPAASPRERFHGLCRHMFWACMSFPREFDFLYWYSYGYVVPDDFRCPVAPSILMLTGIIARAQEEGDLPADAPPSMMARVTRSMMAGIHWSHAHGEHEPSDEAAQRFAEAAWRALGGR